MIFRIYLWLLQFAKNIWLSFLSYLQKQCRMDEYASPLHWAIQKGFRIIAYILIQNGEDTNKLDSNQRSPLDLALERNDLFVFQALVENQADVNFVSVEIGPLLYYAIITYESDAYTKLLINNGANVNCTTVWNQTPLHAAAYHGDTKIAKILIHNGANFYIRDVDNNEPFHYAATNKNIQCAKILIEHGANLNTRSGDGFSPLELALANKIVKNFKFITFVQSSL